LGHQQYLGFKSLAAPAQSLEDHAMFLATHGQYGFSRVTAQQIICDADIYRSAYRTATKLLHPDVPGSNRGTWDKLQTAKAMLDQHHGLVKEEVNGK
jgi:hypothetical protein